MLFLKTSWKKVRSFVEVLGQQAAQKQIKKAKSGLSRLKSIWERGLRKKEGFDCSKVKLGLGWGKSPFLSYNK